METARPVNAGQDRHQVVLFVMVMATFGGGRLLGTTPKELWWWLGVASCAATLGLLAYFLNCVRNLGRRLRPSQWMSLGCAALISLAALARLITAF